MLKYLAPYVHRVAISDNRIVSVDEKTVTFRYTPSKSRQSKTRSVTGHEFVRGFAQHVLPSRLQKIRYYGWMSPNSRIGPEEVRWLVAIALGWAFTLMLARPTVPPRQRARCKECGGELQTVLVADSLGHALYSRPPPYLDTG
ncbi:putative transposase [Rubripirellula obstinata]|uniref:Putative transposase n=1 Tax=Rubripirellula obstinata TaxID=406547 RepID=A0A5B1CQD3_9BACT|nr:putative transposase [Rubripirellula obstinata]